MTHTSIRGNNGYGMCLDEIISICDSYSLTNREFFFDRSPRVFEYILGIYRKGELHLPSSMCPRDFLGELEYWGLSALHLGWNIVKLRVLSHVLVNS